jgi:hypothetical protein
MDPVTLVITALAAGTALGLKDTAATAVRDAYVSLWARVRKRLAGRPDGAMVLARHAEAPQTWEAPLAAELSASGAAQDPDLLAAALGLLRLVDEAGFRSGKYHVDAQNAQGVQIEDHNTQHNSLTSPPSYPPGC